MHDAASSAVHDGELPLFNAHFELFVSSHAAAAVLFCICCILLSSCGRSFLLRSHRSNEPQVLCDDPSSTRLESWAWQHKRLVQHYWVLDKENPKKKTALEWETFEFGSSPKWDRRFDTSRRVIAANQNELETLQQIEADQDVQVTHQLQEKQLAWKQYTVDRATNVLLPFVQPTRVQRIESVLQQRTKRTRFLFGNPANPPNVWACLQTMDAVWDSTCRCGDSKWSL